MFFSMDYSHLKLYIWNFITESTCELTIFQGEVSEHGHHSPIRTKVNYNTKNDFFPYSFWTYCHKKPACKSSVFHCTTASVQERWVHVNELNFFMAVIQSIWVQVHFSDRVLQVYVIAWWWSRKEAHKIYVTLVLPSKNFSYMHIFPIKLICAENINQLNFSQAKTNFARFYCWRWTHIVKHTLFFVCKTLTPKIFRIHHLVNFRFDQLINWFVRNRSLQTHENQF
jgi:hypothetical protein